MTKPLLISTSIEPSSRMSYLSTPIAGALLAGGVRLRQIFDFYTILTYHYYTHRATTGSQVSSKPSEPNPPKYGEKRPDNRKNHQGPNDTEKSMCPIILASSIFLIVYGSLHVLSVRMVETPMLVQAPPSAATRVKPHPISTEIKAQWNREIEALYRGFQNLDQSLTRWGKSLGSFDSRSEGTRRGSSSS